eukprot:11065632-Alexandrium_andersonii.AAC.1
MLMAKTDNAAAEQDADERKVAVKKRTEAKPRMLDVCALALLVLGLTWQAPYHKHGLTPFPSAVASRCTHVATPVSSPISLSPLDC